MRLEVTPRAAMDLDDIAAWLAKDSADRALRVVRRLRAAMREIADRPAIYQLRPEIGAGARLATVQPYVVMFRVLDDRVRIERVVHGSRDLPALISHR